jgi:hypothetical protein
MSVPERIACSRLLFPVSKGEQHHDTKKVGLKDSRG